jgi:acylphosphatase
MKKQVYVYYSGRVQGVGFRFTAQSLAGRLGVSGWVKNLADGRVEILAEAEEEALQEFLSEIKKAFSRYIAEADINWGQPQGVFKDFRVEF